MKKVFRSTALLFLCTTMYAQDISQTMSMNLQNVTLKEFFKNLEAQTSFSVVYRDIILSENPDVVVSASNRPLKDILSQVLEKHGLSYKVSNKTIVIVKAEAQAPVKQRKTKKISGVITDETGLPVAGANIVVKEFAIRKRTNTQNEEKSKIFNWWNSLFYFFIYQFHYFLKF